VNLGDTNPEGYWRDDWKKRANCLGDDRFIREPDTETGFKLLSLCMSCEVFSECRQDADEFQVSGVYQAGGWRGDE
jgi:hypothetical protein